MISNRSLFVTSFLLTTLLSIGCFTIINISGAKASIMATSSENVSSSENAASSENTSSSENAASSENASSARAASDPKAQPAAKPTTSSRISVKIQQAKAPSGKYDIMMENILQRPELPTGCEATALTIVLNSLGFIVDKCDIVDNYLPKTSEQDSLNTYFIGNPYSTSGYGCNAPVIVKTANKYLLDANSKFEAKCVTGSTPDQLYKYVSQGVPVICWATIGMMETQVSATWTAVDTGETVNFMENEHCTVLVGYNTNNSTVTVNDPWSGIVTYSMSVFELRYHQLGSQAIIIT